MSWYGRGWWYRLRCLVGVKLAQHVPQCVLYPCSHVGPLPGLFMASRPESCNSNRTTLEEPQCMSPGS
jgi:hypothetical protein